MPVNQLKKLDITTIPDDALIMCVGKPKSGKTTLVNDIMSHKAYILRGIIIAPTAKFHTQYDTAILTDMFRTQEIMHRENQSRTSETRLDRRAYLVMDGCMTDIHWLQDRNIRGLFMQNRSYGLFVLITLNIMYMMPPGLRGCIDYLFLFSTDSNRLSYIYEQFGYIFPSFDVFNATLDECTKDNGCLVIHLAKPSSILEDVVFWYKSPSISIPVTASIY